MGSRFFLAIGITLVVTFGALSAFYSKNESQRDQAEQEYLAQSPENQESE